MNNPSKSRNILSAAISTVSSAIIDAFLFIGYLMSLLAGSLFRMALSLLPQKVIDLLKHGKAIGNQAYGKFQGFVDFIRHYGESQKQLKKHAHSIHANNKNNAANHEKLLALQNKIRSLQESIFEQTNEKRKMEKELNSSKIQYAQKNAALSREHDENVDNIRKVTILENVVRTVNEELEKQKSKSIEYQEEIKKVQMELKALRAEQKKQGKGNQKKHKKQETQPNSEQGKGAQDSQGHENEGRSGNKTAQEPENDNTNTN